jgi:hypothetical protein
MNDHHHPVGDVDLRIERITVSELALTCAKPQASSENTGAECMWAPLRVPSVLWQTVHPMSTIAAEEQNATSWIEIPAHPHYIGNYVGYGEILN